MKNKIRFCKNKYLNYACIIIVISTLVILIYSLNTTNISEYARVASALILLQMFSFSIGGFLGFLFGFPSHNNVQFQDKYQRNDSLKEITSWLTKIIVGVTLIELKDIFMYLSVFVNELSVSLTNDSSHAFIISCILGVFFVLGFIVLYLLSVTTIFVELVKNDKNIDFLLNDNSMNPSELNINDIFSNDLKEIDDSKKKEILDYISINGLKKLNPILSKRIGKFLIGIKEYNSASKAYKNAYDTNPEDEKYSLLNYCFIQSKYLKNFDHSNSELKKLIENNKDFSFAYYNLACNYIREYLEFEDNNDSEYINKLKEKAETNLKKAFEINKGLYSEALKDEALSILDVKEIFLTSKKTD